MNYNNGNYGKGFNPSFTIPRRREDVRGQFAPFNSNSVLSHSYGNIPYNYPNSQFNPYTRREQMPNSSPPKRFWDNDPSQTNRNTNVWGNDSSQTDCHMNFWGNNSSQTNEDVKVRGNNSSQTNKNVANKQGMYSRRRESDSNTTAGLTRTQKDTYGDSYDATLPKELLSMYQPLFCKLCLIQVTSNTMAKLHYHSKNHEKKVRAWLQGYSERTGEPLHERATAKRLKKDEDFNPKYFRCEVCDLELTGKMHAESHYMGKNHQRALAGKKDPAGNGFYNDEGKWTRTVAAKDDKTGRDGFGQDFAKKEQQEKMTKKERQELQHQILQSKPFKCDLCEISFTSKGQMDTHLLGIKHKKKIMHRDLGVTISQRLAGNDDFVVKAETAVSESVISDDPMAAYRTPSGNFYCKTCDLSLNSNVQFMQHLKSRRHKKKQTNQTSQDGEIQPELGQPESSDDIFAHL